LCCVQFSTETASHRALRDQMLLRHQGRLLNCTAYFRKYQGSAALLDGLALGYHGDFKSQTGGLEWSPVHILLPSFY